MFSHSYYLLTPLLAVLLGTSIALAQAPAADDTDRARDLPASSQRASSAAATNSPAASVPLDTPIRTTNTPQDPSPRAARTEVAEVAQHTGLDIQTQRRIRNLAANLSNRMDATIDRLGQISDRIDSRLEKLAATDIDTTDAVASLARARTELKNAQTTLRDIDGQVATVVIALTPHEQWRHVRRTYTGAGVSIKNAHAALREALILAKTARPRSVDAAPATSSEAAAAATNR